MQVGGDVSIDRLRRTRARACSRSSAFTFNAAGANKFCQHDRAGTSRARPETGVPPAPGHHPRRLGRLGPDAQRADPATAARSRGELRAQRTSTAWSTSSGPGPCRPRSSRSRSARTPSARPSARTPSASGHAGRSAWRSLAVLVFMVFYYRFAGLVACVALLANLLLTVGVHGARCNATFTLPGLAGLVLMLGMAVDANVLIYERLREERDRGASLATAIRNGYDRAFPTIIDTHLTSIFTAIVLYTVGNDQLKGFGISLTVGLIISLFTSLYMTRLMFDFWQAQGLADASCACSRLFCHARTSTSCRSGTTCSPLTGRPDGARPGPVPGPRRAGAEHRLRRRHGLRRPAGRADWTSATLRDLLGDERQKDRLAGDATVERGRRTPARARNVFEITYAGRQPRPWCRCANPPAGATPDEREQDVDRAGPAILPDWSVEQIFIGRSSRRRPAARSSPSARPRRSRSWCRRPSTGCSRDEGKSLLRRRPTVDQVDQGPDGDYLLTFERRRRRRSLTSRRSLERQLQAQPTWASRTSAADVFDVVEDAEQDRRTAGTSVMRVEDQPEANAGIRT